MKKEAARNSIRYKLTIFVIAMLLLQAALFLSFLSLGGVIDKGKEIAYKSFIETAANRNQYLQAEMKNNWSNVKMHIPSFADSILHSKSEQDFFSDSIEDLIKLLRASRASGAFIILIDDEASEEALPALYIRDNDPFHQSIAYSDISYVYGPPEIAQDRQIPLDHNWHYKLRLTDENREALLKAWHHAEAQYDINYLGYWSKPFRIGNGNSSNKIITYTLPFFDAQKNLRGIIGTEVSLNYLQEFLPASDIQIKDSLGYLLAYRSHEAGDLEPVLTTGALQRRIIDEDQPLILKEAITDSGLYKLENHKGSGTIYASMQKIGMYFENTPFFDESWYLIALKEKDSLFSYINRLGNVFMIAFVLSLILAMVGSASVGLFITRPITRLAEEVRKKGGRQKIQPEKTGLYEVDELARAMAASSNALLESSAKLSKVIGLLDESASVFEYSENTDDLFVSDSLQEVFRLTDQEMEEAKNNKADFLKGLALIYANPEPEEDFVYQLPSQPPAWVRIKTIKNNGGILGVAQDVSEEIREKKRIKKERDYDVLTGLYNRGAGDREFRNIVKEREGELKEAALVMLDLDSLKDINDNYGHNFGDAYIKEAANRMRVIGNPENTILSRRSGDEFLLFFYGYPDKDAIRREMDFFFDSLDDFPMDFPDGQKRKIPISAGLAWYESLKIGYEEVINIADKAMYKAKRDNKGSLVEAED